MLLVISWRIARYTTVNQDGTMLSLKYSYALHCRNAYANSLQSDAYSPVYTSNALPALYSMTAPRHVSSVSNSSATNKVRNMAPNQIATSAVTRFPPALTPINDTSNIIRTSNSTSVHSSVSSNVSGAMVAGSRPPRTNFSQGGGEIIDLSSPPHSPQYTNNSSLNRIPSVSSNSFNYGKTNSNTHLPPLIHINDGASPMKNGIPPYKVSSFGEAFISQCSKFSSIAAAASRSSSMC